MWIVIAREAPLESPSVSPSCGSSDSGKGMGGDCLTGELFPERGDPLLDLQGGPGEGKAGKGV